MINKFYSHRALATSFLTAMLLVAVEVSWSISLFSAVVLLWRLGAEKWSLPVWTRKVTGTLSVIVLAFVFFEYKTLIGQEPSFTFLLGLSALRVMEYRDWSDRRFIVLLGFVLLAVKALFSIDIYWIVPTLISFFGLWYALLPAGMPTKNKYLFKTVLKAIPLTAILFVVFPRFIIPWAMSRGIPQGEVGFSTELNPGSVAQLASNDKVVFRVRFFEPVASVHDLYWRGAILSRARGLRWRPGDAKFLPQDLQKAGAAQYEVAIEPSGTSNYLFTLDPTHNVEMPESRVLVAEGRQYRTMRLIQRAAVYRGYMSKQEDSSLPTDEDLKVPRLTGETQKWVGEKKKTNPSPQEALQILEKFFSDPDFSYTLSPGTYGDDELNEFLFKRRKGFCEHFAGAYASLARALSIPARVVVGFHGGLYNEWGEFWRVSQKDAHAWVEVYVEKRWKRVDPTEWVAPLRLRVGAESFFGMSEADQQIFAKSVDWQPRNQAAFWGLGDVGFWIESLNYRWMYFLIEFDLESQSLLLQALNEFKWLLLLGLSFVVGAIAVLRSTRLRRAKLSPEERLLLSLEAWGDRHHQARLIGETPLQYLGRLQGSFKSPLFLEAAEVYERVVYAGVEDRHRIPPLLSGLKKLKPDV
jgi:transglutaminase-like putative cysteine protease